MKVELPLAQVKTGRESGSWAPQRDRWGKTPEGSTQPVCHCIAWKCTTDTCLSIIPRRRRKVLANNVAAAKRVVTRELSIVDVTRLLDSQQAML